MPGHYRIHRFWFKKSTSIHNRLALEMNRYLKGALAPREINKGKIILTQKGTAVNNYRPISWLRMVWKIVTQIREEVYSSLTIRGLFPEEQKGKRKGSRGTWELLDIDQHILNESKCRRKNLAMAWIDYKNASDMDPQSWIINCRKMYKISDEVINFIERTMKIWKVEWKAEERSLAEAKI